MNSNNHITVDQIKNDAEVIKKELVECRHYLHAHPELSFKEERTTHYIVNKLKNFGYLPRPFFLHNHTFFSFIQW